jgi:hypothetical protein
MNVYSWDFRTNNGKCQSAWYNGASAGPTEREQPTCFQLLEDILEEKNEVRDRVVFIVGEMDSQAVVEPLQGAVPGWFRFKITRHGTPLLESSGDYDFDQMSDDKLRETISSLSGRRLR